MAKRTDELTVLGEKIKQVAEVCLESEDDM
jgi:hypothetical protein